MSLRLPLIWLALLIAQQLSSFEAHAYRACIQSNEIPQMGLMIDGQNLDINDYLIYSRTFDGPINRRAIENSLDNFLCRERSSVTFGPGNDPFTIVLRVRNIGSHKGIWTLSTSRFTVRSFRIYDVTNTEPALLVDSSNRLEALRNVREHMGFGAHFSLEPGEERLFAMKMKVETGTGFPVSVLPVEKFSQVHFANSTIVSALASAIIVIALLNGLLFLATQRSSFAWLALAEISFGFFVLQSLGFVSRFGLAYYPDWNILIADIPKSLFCAFMSQFARSFLETRQKYPIADIFLKSMVFIGMSISLLWLVSPLISEQMRSLLRTLTWASGAVVALYLPFAGAVAFRAKGIHYLPLLIGWSVYGLTMLYFIIGFTNLIPNLPMRVTWLGVAGLIEGVFVSIALVLQIYAANEAARQTSRQYQNSLEERIALVQERELATATIKDQSALLQASGHDTRQVLLSINSAAHHLELVGHRDDAELLNTLKASAAFLEDILSTTLSVPTAYAANRECVALSLFSVADFLQFLEKIYRPLFHRAGLKFNITADEDIWLISDKALLARIISNFMMNSLQFTDKGGLSCRASIHNSSVFIELEDTGRGIEKQALSVMLMDTSESIPTIAKNAGSGSGFKIAQTLIKRIKGKLEVVSEVGKGTVLKLSLPVAVNGKGATPIEKPDTHSNFILHDIDREGVPADKFDLPVIGITFDASPQMRSKASESCSFILHKPLMEEMLDHPALKDDENGTS